MVYVGPTPLYISRRNSLQARSPTAQVVLVGITCFGTVGMFSAVSNLGAGGTEDVALSDTANGVLYGFFALTGFISGGICNCASSRVLTFFKY